jgi:hypothetical protein
VFRHLQGSVRADTFPPLQVILLDEKRSYEIRRDEELKLLALAPWQIDALRGEAGKGRGDDGLFADLMPRAAEARRAQARLEQRIALLRHVEGLRLYAADHAVKLPTRLTDIAVPLPPDPFTGQPFGYAPNGATAHFRGASTPRYEVTVKK